MVDDFITLPIGISFTVLTGKPLLQVCGTNLEDSALGLNPTPTYGSVLPVNGTIMSYYGNSGCKGVLTSLTIILKVPVASFFISYT
jgi:hypothetical protein